jgi:3-methyladenine DNA glycosylase AlkD
MNLREELFKNQDLKYKSFQSKLIPNINSDKILGVRIPVLRKIAKQVYNESVENLCEYYEEQIVYGLTIGLKKCDTQQHINDIKSFVPLIDNWATCDICSSSFKFINKDKDNYYDFIISYIGKSEFETRFAVVMLMSYYLDDKYIDDVLDILKSINSDYYYVNMAVAWALSVAFVKYENKTFEIIKSKSLSKDVQNKTIQKIKDSLRVDKETKLLLNNYKL